ELRTYRRRVAKVGAGRPPPDDPGILVRELVRVVTNTESAARDASAVAAGVPSRALMQRAGAAAAGEIALRFRDRLSGGVLVLAGPGNNGGDAWVVARALAAVGAKVRVVEPVPAKTTDAMAERALALETPNVRRDDWPASLVAGEAIVVDGLLGTGASGAPRGALGDAIEWLSPARARGAVVVALDLPSGVDASTGATPGSAVGADVTVTFATVKRAHLVARDACGAIVVVDIGLGGHASLDDGAPALVDERWAGAALPAFPADANKGTRKKLAIVGGAPGMAGAAALARDILSWADGVVVGPGLGRDTTSRALLERLLRAWRGPTLLDADAITLFERRVPDLAALIGDRAALLTPHAVEFSRLAGVPVEEV